MGRIKPGKTPRRSRAERIESRIAVRVGAAQAVEDRREAFILAFGDMMTDAEKDEYRRTGIFEE